MESFPSPKQSQTQRQKDWYPYYAGYTAAFASRVFEMYFGCSGSVLDPWNGSGTTTAVASACGMRSLGIDLNPALTIIARARLAPQERRSELLVIATCMVDMARAEKSEDRENDPLAAWLQPQAVRAIRKLQRAVHLLTGEATSELELASGSPESASGLRTDTAFFYAALFATCRDLMRSFRGSNPTWHSSPASQKNRLRPNSRAIESTFLDRVSYLSERLVVSDLRSADLADLQTGPSESLLPRDGSFDACLTSPPYATRIDYIKSSLPELALLGLDPKAILELRRASTGTPVVRGVAAPEAHLSACAGELIAEVAQHDSHGSANYYAPWLRNYLMQLHEALDALSLTVKPSGHIAIVVQDSYYKGIHIDLQSIVIASLEAADRRLLDRHDFMVNRSMSQVNTRARQHLPMRAHSESLLVFE